MTVHHHDFGLGAPNLPDFMVAIADALRLVKGEGAAAPAAVLVAFGRKQIDPVFHELVQHPAGLFVVAMPEKLLGFAAVVAGIVVRHALANLAFVQEDAVGFDIIDRQIEHVQGSVAIEELRELFRQPVTGGQVGMPSLWVPEVADVQFLHVYHDPAHKHLHGFVVSGEKPPVLAGEGEVFPEYVNDLPPVHHVFVLGVDHAGVLALAAQGAQPRQLALDKLKVPAQQNQPNELARVESADPGERAAGSRA